MTSIKSDKDLDTEKEPLERFRTFNLIFEKSLPYLVMDDLLTEKTFISKYPRIHKARMDEEIQALVLYDYMDINYVLTLKKIEAKSAIIENPEIIKESLKSMADLIIKLYNLEFKYKIDDGLDFQYIEHYDLQKVINGAEITKLLKKEFGDDIYIVQCKYIHRTRTGDKVINLVYTDETELKNGHVLLEADEKYINRIHGALKDD